jgi:hypothetical protein
MRQFIRDDFAVPNAALWDDQSQMVVGNGEMSYPGRDEYTMGTGPGATITYVGPLPGFPADAQVVSVRVKVRRRFVPVTGTPAQNDENWQYVTALFGSIGWDIGAYIDLWETTRMDEPFGEQLVLGTPEIAGRWYDLRLDITSSAWEAFIDGASQGQVAHSFTTWTDIPLLLFAAGLPQTGSYEDFAGFEIQTEGYPEIHFKALKMLSPVHPGGDYDSSLRAEGLSLDLAMASVDNVGKQAIVDSATAALPDWARILGLSTASGADAVVAKLRARGDLSRSYFEAIATKLGFNVGTHEQVGDPHIRLVRGEFLPFRLGYSRLDIDPLWSQGEGASQWTVVVYGTDVESLVVERSVSLRAMLGDLACAASEFVFSDE